MDPEVTLKKVIEVIGPVYGFGWVLAFLLGVAIGHGLSIRAQLLLANTLRAYLLDLYKELTNARDDQRSRDR